MSEKELYLTKLNEHINKVLKRKKTIAHEDKLKLWHDIDIALKEDHEFDRYNSIFCKQLFDNMFVCSYKYEAGNKLEVDIFIEDQQVLKPSFEVPPEYKQKLEIFNKLKLIPQPEQKSPEWFKQREGMITASMIATVTGDDPYSNLSNALEEKVRGAVFKDNINTYHGKKYEPIAQKFYSIINNVEISEFGIIRSEKYDFLGASPDGICTCYTLNKEFSPLLGRMLEIKCPAQRDIKTSGNLFKRDKQDGIIPYYYWCQTQLQMEVCNLDECDFFQCSLSEYNSREEYLRDIVGNEYYREQGEKIQVKDNIKKGAIIELMPKKCINLPHVFMAKYLYPETIDMTTQQYDDWVMNIIYDFNDTNELAKEYYFSRVIYWKMNKTHTQLIKRDQKWFEEKLPLMDKFWKDVVYYKAHGEELDKYLEELRKKEKKIGGSDYFKNKIPEIYKKLSRSMDLTTNPYLEDKTDTPPTSLVSPAPKRTYTKSSVFMKPKETQKKFIKEYDFDFLSDT
jgi:putative phage-type endonuclease